MWIQSIPSHWQVWNCQKCELKGNILQRPTWSVFRSVWIWVPFCHCDIQHIIDLSLSLSVSLSLSMHIYIYLPHTSPYYFWGHRSWLFPPVQLHPQATEASQKAADPVLLGLVLYACQGWRSNHLCPIGIQTWMILNGLAKHSFSVFFPFLGLTMIHIYFSGP